jgi:hypothetical protein
VAKHKEVTTVKSVVNSMERMTELTQEMQTVWLEPIAMRMQTRLHKALNKESLMRTIQMLRLADSPMELQQAIKRPRLKQNPLTTKKAEMLMNQIS